MLRIVTLILTVVAVLLPANDALSTKMTKNLKVVVSSNDFPESGLNVLKDQSWNFGSMGRRLNEEAFSFNFNRQSVLCSVARPVYKTVEQTDFVFVQSRFSHFGEEGATENKEELLNLIPGSSALVWISHHPITKELLDKAGPQLKIVSTASAGYNHCNVPELKARGIKLSNTPNVLSSAVAEIAVGLILGAARRFTENLQQVRSGQWESISFNKVLGQDVRGSTVGIVGLGGIGQATVKRLAGFEVARFLYTGHREKPEAKALNAEFVSLDTLLQESDFVVLAVPLTDETRHMINSTTLGKMKSNAILVNVGRGDLVDQDALYDALKNKTIYAAGLDVTTPEPLPKDHKLLTLPNLFVLPHIGSATVRTRSDMAVLAAENVVNALTGKPLITPVLP